MEYKKPILLSKFDISLENLSFTKFSNKFRNVFLLKEDGKGYLYETNKTKDNQIQLLRLAWEHENIKRATFSKDGRFLITINKNTNDIEIFDISTKSNINLYYKELLANFKKFLSNWDCRIELTEQSDIDIVLFTEARLILSLDLRWIVSLEWPGLTSVIFAFEMASCARISICNSLLYSLTADGILSAFSLTTGEQLNGVINLADPLYESEQTFVELVSSQDGHFVAATTSSGRIHLADIIDCFTYQIKPIEPVSDSSARSDSDTLSLSSTTKSISSKLSFKSTSSLRSALSTSFRSETSHEPRPTHSKEKLFKSTWNIYLNSLQMHKSPTLMAGIPEKLEFSRNYVSLPKPIIYIKPDEGYSSTRGCWLTAGGLSVWFSSETDQQYRLYDPANGRCLWRIPLPEGSIILGASLPGPTDLWLLKDGFLALYVGNLAKDLLFSKLLQNIPIEMLSQLLHISQWPADLYLTPASLIDRIRHGDFNLAKLVFAVQRNTDLGSSTDGVSSLDTLFELIYPVLFEPNIQESNVQQLHELTLNYLLYLLEMLHKKQSLLNFIQFEPQAEQTQELKKRYINHLTNIITWQLKKRKVKMDHNKSVDEALNRMDSRWNEWQKNINQGDDVSVIRESILTRSLPVLHTCYLSHPSFHITTKTFLERIKHLANEWILYLCTERLFSQAEDVIEAMGDDHRSTLREICLNTFNVALRDGLVEELLKKDDWISKEEVESWHFIQQIENVLKLNPDINYELFTLEDLNIYQITTNKSPEWKTFVRIELFFKTLDSSLEKDINAENAWDYLLKIEQINLIKDWIEICLGDESKQFDCPFLLKGTFLKWGLHQSLIDSLEKNPSVISEDVLDYLSTFGRFSSTEKQQLASILSRLLNSNSLKSIQPIFNRSSANLTYKEFHFLVIKYLINNDVPQAAFPCLMDFIVDEESNFFIELPEDHWWHLWRVFKIWSKNKKDSEAFQSATLASLRFLSTSKSPLLDTALVLLRGQSLNETFSQEDHASDLEALPLLHLALKFNVDKSPDITIYQLLQGRTPFDVSKLFLWLQENDQEEMPHFAHSRYVAKYGHTVTYDYLACLRDARPCYATAMFISQQKEKYGKLSKKMRSEACGYAHGLALQRYSDPRLVAACIAFVHLVGGNVTPLRIHTNVARTVELHLEQFAHIQKSNSLKQQIGDILHGLIKKKKSAEGLLMLLERSLLESKINRISGQMILWDLAIQMAQLHQLPLPEGFLIKCARKDLWLPFIVFLELYQYPLQQAIKLVRYFKSPALQDHLYHALNYEIEDPPQVSAGTRLAQRDARKLLYTRIGLSKQTSNSESPEGSPPNGGSTISPSIYDPEDDCTASVLSVSVTGDIGVRDPSRDLFLVLLECHANADPPRALLARAREYSNPVLALLATCYEPSSMVASLCTWLVVSLSEDMPSTLMPEFAKAAQNDIWTSRHLESLLETCVEQGRVATLANGFKIFLPDNPLCDFTDFLMQCVLKKNFKDILNLKLFKMACMNLKNNPIADQTDDPEGLFLSNGHWVANQVIRMTNLALGHCFTSAYQQLTFLQTLCQNGFTDYLAVRPPDYHHWSQLIECLINNGTGVYLDLTLLSRDGEATTLEYRRVIDELIARQHFDDALIFAGLANCSKDAIVMAQGHVECEQLLNNEQEPTQAFWEKCNRTFQNANVQPANAVKFFKEYSEKITTYKDKFLILRMALDWQQRIPSTEDSYASLEKAMWSFWLLDDTQQSLDNLDSTTILITKSRHELLKNATLSAVASDNLKIDHIYNSTRIDCLIRQLLERNQIDKACRVTAMFDHKSQDVRMLLACLELAEGDLSPYELTSEQRSWLSEPSMTSLASFRRRTTTPRNTPRQFSSSTFNLSSLKLDRIDDSSWQYLSCSMASDVANTSQNNSCIQDTVQVLENLSARISHGRALAMRILACYRLSAHLEMNFLQIWQNENPLDLLSQINRNDSDETHSLVSDLLIASQVSKQNLAQILADHIDEAINKEEKIVWGCDLETHFHMLLDLCDDPSLLGEALVSQTTKTTNPSTKVELLIRAHDAFSNACNMEGIADILTRARTLINTLQSKQLWPLMVRLLIGVGRYNEMNYIFQILKENDQFESLLGRGFFKENGFKLALLEFLRRRCPSDRELYRIAALHFGMHSELAEMWEAETLDVLKRFLKQSTPITEESWLPRTEDTLQTLRQIMEGYTHAAQYYLQADKLNRALSSAYWAELVALQISLVQPDNSITNEENRAILLLLLAPARVSQIINNYLSFPQACIVVRAYSHPVDWSAALYSHCILQGDETYLTDFTHTTPLTTSLVEEVARRYQSETQVTSAMAAQMRRFVKAIGPVDIKYRIASQLGFRDILESMLNGAELAYLKDTVWRRGFSLYPYL